jgi:hypothetical protein
LAPPPQSRLATVLHVGGSATLRPAPASYRPRVTLAAAWSRSQLVVERKARYQVFLARIWSPLLGKPAGPFFHGQVFWVVLAEGIAGPQDHPTPSTVSATPQPASCAFSGRYGFSFLSATTAGRPYVVG